MAALTQEVGGTGSRSSPLPRGIKIPLRRGQAKFPVEMRQADLLVTVGLQLEIGLAPASHYSERQSQIQVGANGY